MAYKETSTEAAKDFKRTHVMLLEKNSFFYKFQTCINVVALKWMSKLAVVLVAVLPYLLLASLVIIPMMIFKFIFVNVRLYIKTKGNYPLLSDYDFSMDEDDDTDEAYAEITNPFLLGCLRFIDGHIEYEYIRVCSLFDAFDCFCETINNYFDDDGRNT